MARATRSRGGVRRVACDGAGGGRRAEIDQRVDPAEQIIGGAEQSTDVVGEIPMAGTGHLRPAISRRGAGSR